MIAAKQEADQEARSGARMVILEMVQLDYWVTEERRFLLLECRCMVKNFRQVMATVLLGLGSFSWRGAGELPVLLLESALLLTLPAAEEMLKRLGSRLMDFFSVAAGVVGTERFAKFDARWATGDSSCRSGR